MEQKCQNLKQSLQINVQNSIRPLELNWHYYYSIDFEILRMSKDGSTQIALNQTFQFLVILKRFKRKLKLLLNKTFCCYHNCLICQASYLPTYLPTHSPLGRWSIFEAKIATYFLYLHFSIGSMYLPTQRPNASLRGSFCDTFCTVEQVQIEMLDQTFQINFN